MGCGGWWGVRGWGCEGMVGMRGWWGVRGMVGCEGDGGV